MWKYDGYEAEDFPEIPELREQDLPTPPEGFCIMHGWGLCVSHETGISEFRLTDRSFTELDYHFYGKLLHHIEELVSNREDTSAPIRILDLACGPRGVAADQLQSIFGDAVEVHGVDFFLAKPEARLSDFGAQAEITQANAIDELPYPDGYFDFIFSYQFLPYVCSTDEMVEYPEKFKSYMNCVVNTGRVLKPDREAWLDDILLARCGYIPFDHPIEQRLMANNLLSTRDYKEKRLDGSMHTQGGPNPYLVLKKLPQY